MLFHILMLLEFVFLSSWHVPHECYSLPLEEGGGWDSFFLFFSRIKILILLSKKKKSYRFFF